MALNMIGLNTTLTKGFTQYNTTGLDAGKHIKDAIQKYISQCMNAAGGTFATMPKLSHTIEVTNPNTKKKSSIVLEGLADFFG